MNSFPFAAGFYKGFSGKSEII